eukprot:TRINITY_DN4143_c0_g1_i2.p1 TRINITY_DN4143_c0_g1~~TRINITY_DN4143_c0_g1_i2.p1  ORF type:complete len:128 (+),score=8.20 TRINITY_DN4143_c0_g1_i2:151-534(+)
MNRNPVNFYFLQGSISFVRLGLFYFCQRVHTMDDLSEKGVLLVQIRERIVTDEKLGSIGVGSLVGHRHCTSHVLDMRVIKKKKIVFSLYLEFSKFVIEILAINALSTFTRPCGISSLYHEFFYISMK